MGGKGPGNVTKKDIGSESGWGDLPPKEREEAMQQIGRDFPSHYRDVIEQYFRPLAAEEEANECHEAQHHRYSGRFLLISALRPPFEVQMLDGRTVTGPLVELTADRVTSPPRKGTSRSTCKRS